MIGKGLGVGSKGTFFGKKNSTSLKPKRRVEVSQVKNRVKPIADKGGILWKGPKATGSLAGFKTERKPVWLSSGIAGSARSHRC